MSAAAPKVHFNLSPSPPAYSPPPAYAMFTENEGFMTFAQKERMASVAESKLQYLVSQKRREPSLRQVLLHAGFLERVLDSLDASTPEPIAEEPELMEEEEEFTPSFEVSSNLTTIVEVDEMEVDEEEEEELTLTRTVSHRPGSPVSDEEDLSDDSDDELPSPPPQYVAPAVDHPLFNLMEVREKARREELASQFRIERDDPSHQQLYFMNNNLAVAA